MPFVPAAGKSSRDRSRSGMTLLELLTVVAIMGILLALLFTAGNTAREASRRAQAKNDLLQMVAAIKAFKTEYGRFPIKQSADGQDTEVTFATDNSDLVYTLSAIPKGSNEQHALNPRQIVFLQIPNVRDPQRPTAGLAGGNWYDPWGAQGGKPESGIYHVRIDGTQSGVVTDPYPGEDDDDAGPSSGARKTIPTDVIAWSLARTGVQTYQLKDQVLSWK